MNPKKTQILSIALIILIVVAMARGGSAALCKNEGEDCRYDICCTGLKCVESTRLSSKALIKDYKCEVDDGKCKNEGEDCNTGSVTECCEGLVCIPVSTHPKGWGMVTKSKCKSVVYPKDDNNPNICKNKGELCGRNNYKCCEGLECNILRIQPAVGGVIVNRLCGEPRKDPNCKKAGQGCNVRSCCPGLWCINKGIHRAGFVDSECREEWCPGIRQECGLLHSCCPGLSCSSTISGTCEAN